MLSPAVLLIVALVGWPIWKVFSLSLHEIDLHAIMKAVTTPMTLANYQRAIFTWDFVDTLVVTGKYVAYSTGLALILGFATALLLHGTFVGRPIFSTVVAMPWAIAPVFASIVWMFLFDAQFGLINYALISVGIIQQPVEWIVDAQSALWALIVAHVWKSYPFFTVMLLAGLQAIPKALYEAAEVDGAGWFRRLSTSLFQAFDRYS
jgi:multiple sugar transport system permease protein